MPDLLRHVRTLANEIGPRTATGSGEAVAATYIAEAARGYTHQVWTEPFLSVTASYWPWLWLLCPALAGALAFAWHPGAALLLSAPAAAALVWRAAGRRILRWPLWRRASQNVVAVVPCTSAIRRRVVLVAHYDTGSQFPTSITPGKERMGELAVSASVVILPILALLALLWPDPIWWVLSSLAAGVVASAALGLVFWEVRGRAEARMLDNAPGVAALLHAGEALAAARLLHTEVWCLFTGCKQAQMAGLHGFLDRHGHMLADAEFIVLDGVGCSSFHYGLGEGNLPFRSADDRLTALARAVASGHPEWGITGAILHEARTEAYALTARGHRAIALVGVRGGARLEPADLADPVALDRTIRLLCELTEQIDRQASFGEEEPVG